MERETEPGAKDLEEGGSVLARGIGAACPEDGKNSISKGRGARFPKENLW